MKYTVPDYYRKFKCIASECPATCCAGWQIVIDDRSLGKYRRFEGAFGNRLANSIDWREKVFEQYGKRCAFLNEENLCDIYSEAGSDMLCRTCRNYPRHMEEFENEREISLSLSCPVVARMLLTRQEKVGFVEKWTDTGEEEDDSFDFFLYSALQDVREVMIKMMQDRSEPAALRMGKVLALAHDVQNRIDAGQTFGIEELLAKYCRDGAGTRLNQKLEKYRDSSELMKRMQNLLQLLDELEVLDSSWKEQLRIYREALYGAGTEGYRGLREADRRKWGGADRTDLECEQLMVYFLFTYFCGAVYDGDALAKVKMAAVSTLLIREMEHACQFFWDEPVTAEDRARIAWRYSRELEHSDLNLNKMEELMNESEAAEFENLLYCVMNI